MGRRKLTSADVLREQAIVVTADDAVGERWTWLDWDFLPFGDFLELIGMPKGRFESYLRRKVIFPPRGSAYPMIDFLPAEPGSGVHVRYTARQALKLIAIDRLAQAGAWNWCLYQTFRRKGSFDLILNAYQGREYKETGPRPEPILMNTQVDRLMMETGKPHPFKNEVELNLARIQGEWPAKEWCYIEFDVATFIETTVSRLVAFFRNKGVTEAAVRLHSGETWAVPISMDYQPLKRLKRPKTGARPKVGEQSSL